jgi:hypothetical protein
MSVRLMCVGRGANVWHFGVELPTVIAGAVATVEAVRLLLWMWMKMPGGVLVASHAASWQPDSSDV